MKKNLQILFLVLFFLPLAGFAQPYWNEWIQFQQQYYKIPVTQNGVYRLDYSTLAGAGINVSNIDFRNFQIFFRGQEQLIYTYDKNKNDTLDLSDYIEFYGQKNDGSLDSILYKSYLYDKPEQQPNPYYSLFNDTSMYFLTWNNKTNNIRIVDAYDTIYTLPQTNYFMKEVIIENHTNYYYGNVTTQNIHFPDFDQTEGWAGEEYGYCNSCISQFYSKTFPLTNFYSAGDSVEIKTGVMGESNDNSVVQDHHIQVKYKDANGNYNNLDDIWFAGYQLYTSFHKIVAAVFGNSTDIIVNAPPPAPASTSRFAVPYITIKFPHTTIFDGSTKPTSYEMFVPHNFSQSKSDYTFTNFDDLNSNVYVYDFTNHTRIPVTKSGNNYKVLIANSFNSSEKFCVIKSEKTPLPAVSLKKVNGTGFFTDYSKLAADSAYIIVTHKSLANGVNNYSAYRSGISGGLHNVIVADIDDLYDQFAYGIQKHPFSIRHFAEFCYDNFTAAPNNFSPPEDIFLIGKSIKHEKLRNPDIGIYHPNYQWGNYLANYSACLVPSLGFPTCDNMLVDALNGNLMTPLIPIGRLAANNSNEVNTYLAKVKEYEHPVPDPDEWMKHVIHMAGGKDAGQQAYLCGLMSNYEQIIEDTCFGGFVHGFCKNSSSPTQTSYTDSIKGLVNNGVSLITFFGHSSASVFDFNLLPPDQYDNSNGKYPFFTAAGCVAGDIHDPGNGTSSELYVLDKKGMIGMLASSGPGTPGDLDAYVTDLYKNVGHYLYGKPIGKCIQTVIDSIEGTAQDNLRNATCLEMTLHGDPAIIVHAKLLPDYEVNNASVYFSPAQVSTDMDSFKVNVIVNNLGRATNDSVAIELKRTFADGSFSFSHENFKHIYYKDTISFTLPVDPIKGPGLNKFEVRVDSANKVDELDNFINNNLIGNNEVPLLIYSGDIIPVFPYEYAIIPNDTVTLKAYTANPFTNTGNYIFELDTTDLFNSPVLKTQFVKQNKGAVVKAWFTNWDNQTKFSDSTVYFWRVRRDTADTANFHWKESSFQYISQKRGWGQSHFFQFLKGDQYKYIDTNRQARRFDLDYTTHVLDIKVSNFHYTKECYIFHIDNNEISQCSSISSNPDTNQSKIPHVVVTIVDGTSGYAWKNPGTGIYGSAPVAANNLRYEFYLQTNAQIDSLSKFLKNIIPTGDKVILCAENNHNLGDLLDGGPLTNPNLVAAFQSIGGIQFPNIKNNYPYILMGRKGGTAVESIGASVTDQIFLTDTLKIKRESGYIYSEIIGPASKWNSFHWNYHLPSPVVNDSIKIDLIGIKNNNGTDTLIKGITKTKLDIYNLDSVYSASTYPYLKLRAWTKDTVKKTPPQLNFWRIYYDGVPEAALNPVKHFSFYNPVVQQGDSLKMSIAIENIGEYNMDSLWVDFWILDANRNKVLQKSFKMDSLLIDSILVPSVNFGTDKLPAGASSLWVEANPFNTQHQLEQYHFNNIGTLSFTVNADKINPVLDVTFDGVHIMNGDIVSAKPSVTIKLKDENTFLALNDTSAFQVFLKRPSGSTYEKIHFGSNMNFYPAQLPNNSCRISYNPVLADGIYTLRVQAKDRSGNASGYSEYTISFEVINKPTVTSVLNYPNPFSTSTRFVFTLTGSQIPDYFKIQILTITGKIVREIDRHELGSLHIGRNITDYVWDGKDEFGDQLANGLYLYRVVTQLNGKSLEHRDTDADSFFTQGYGKMYLIR